MNMCLNIKSIRQELTEMEKKTEATGGLSHHQQHHLQLWPYFSLRRRENFQVRSVSLSSSLHPHLIKNRLHKFISLSLSLFLDKNQNSFSDILRIKYRRRGGWAKISPSHSNYIPWNRHPKEGNKKLYAEWVSSVKKREKKRRCFKGVLWVCLSANHHHYYKYCRHHYLLFPREVKDVVFHDQVMYTESSDGRTERERAPCCCVWYSNHFMSITRIKECERTWIR